MGWKQHKTENLKTRLPPLALPAAPCGTLGKCPLPPHPNEGVIAEDLQASCSVLSFVTLVGMELDRKGALKEVSVGQDLEEGRFADTEEGNGIPH